MVLQEQLSLQTFFRVFPGSTETPFSIVETFSSSLIESEECDFKDYDKALEYAYFYHKTFWTQEHKNNTHLLKNKLFFWDRVKDLFTTKKNNSSSCDPTPYSLLKAATKKAKQCKAMSFEDFKETGVESSFIPATISLSTPIINVGTPIYCVSAEGFLDGRGVVIVEREIRLAVTSESGQDTDEYTVSIEYILDNQKELPSVIDIEDGEILQLNSNFKTFIDREKAIDYLKSLFLKTPISYLDKEGIFFDGCVEAKDITSSEFEKRADKPEPIKDLSFFAYDEML